MCVVMHLVSLRVVDPVSGDLQVVKHQVLMNYLYTCVCMLKTKTKKTNLEGRIYIYIQRFSIDC